MRKYLLMGLIVLAACVGAASPVTAQQTEKTSGAKILLAGTGTQPHTQNVMDGLTEYFASVGIPVRQVSMDGKSRTDIIDKMPEMGAESFLLLSVHLQAGSLGDKGVLQCWNAQGKKLWEEEGGVGRFTLSAGSAEKNIVKNLQKKLEKRTGGPGLPKK